MAKRKNRRKQRQEVAALTGRGGEGSPIETRCQARGIVQTDRRKRASKNRCRRKGRVGNPRNGGF